MTFSLLRQVTVLMTELRPATSPPPVRMPMRFLAKLTSQHWHAAIMHSEAFLLGRFRFALPAQPKTLQQCGHGVAEATILQLGIGQHRGARPALAAHLDCLALGAPADLVPRRVVEEIGIGLGKAAFLVDRKAGARNARQAVQARPRCVKWYGHDRHHVRAARIAAYEVRLRERRDDFFG